MRDERRAVFIPPSPFIPHPSSLILSPGDSHGPDRQHDDAAWAPLPPTSRLPDTTGKIVSRDDFRSAPALLVMFICNHCPYVKHVAAGLAQLARDYQARGVAVVGINSNDYRAYPDDAPEKMAEEVRQRGYTFPYLLDETQAVAKAYGAACTPDFFLFDRLASWSTAGNWTPAGRRAACR